MGIGSIPMIQLVERCVRSKKSSNLTFSENGSSAARMVEVQMAWYIIMSPVSLEPGMHGMKFQWKKHVPDWSRGSFYKSTKTKKYHVIAKQNVT